MTSENQDFLEMVRTISDNDTFKSEVAQIRSKALLREVSHSIPKFEWNYVESRIIRNILAASFMLETLSNLDPTKLQTIEESSRRLALIWESLGKLGEKTTREKAFMNAAIVYELAGHQANATCLARQIYRNFATNTKPSVEVLASAFLQRLFLRVRLLSESLLKEPKEMTDTYKIIAASALALAAEGFVNASDYFLSGNTESLAKAKKSFIDCERILADIGSVEDYNIIRSIRSLLPVMELRSTWTLLGGALRNNRLWDRYLRLLARGTGALLLNSPSISELWPSQIKALSSGLLSSTSSKVIKMPTSAGKTRVAELAIVYTLVTEPSAKCVYIAPYRALVWELEQVFLNLFGDLGFRVSSVIGAYETDDFEQLLMSDADILVMTPEKLDLLQRAQPDFLSNVRLFIMDEGHIITDDKRGIKFELLLTRLMRKLSNARFLFLSAVVPQETLEEFARWLKADKGDIIESKWRPSIQRFAKFYWIGENGFIRYDASDDNPLLREFVPGVIEQREYEYQNPQTGRINRVRFPEISSRAQTAAELAFKFAELGAVLVFCSQGDYAEAVANALLRRLGYARSTNEQLPEYFHIERPLRSIMVAEDWLGNDHLVTNLLRNGIAVHHGKLPEAVRKSIETDFRDRRFRVIVATNTLAQGVNLPIRTVVVHSCRRYIPDKHSTERIPGRDYWNISGRAGRAGEETEGTIIHMVMNTRDEGDYLYYRKQRDALDPIRSALFKLLDDLTQERLTTVELREMLDPEILAILVEEGGEDLQNAVETILDQSLVKEQVIRSKKLNIGHLKKAFVETAKDIMETAHDQSYWPVYSSTGLSTNSCEFLRQYIESRGDALTSALRNTNVENLDTFLAMIMEALTALPEMDPDRQFDGDYLELLRGWQSGISVHELGRDSQLPTEDIAKFIEEFFAYLMPWGISAFTRIAIFVLKLTNDDISDYTKFLPAMVKYGVPTPAASWAMTAGVPFRKTAMNIAAKYMSETNSPNYQNFQEWIGKINSETLHREFNLESPVLEDVTIALFRAGFNPLLRQTQDLRSLLKEGAWIAGISYGNRRIVANSARINQVVQLRRDYDNPMDHNAIRTLLDGQELGFVDRYLAQLLAPYMDTGMKLIASIVKIERGRVPQIEIRIDLQD